MSLKKLFWQWYSAPISNLINRFNIWVIMLYNLRFIGEESFAAGIKEKLTSAPTWVIDPVDGTTNFVHSYPNVCISIGLAVDCEVQLGVIFNPVLDMFFRAIKGEGAFLNDEPISVSGTKSK